MIKRLIFDIDGTLICNVSFNEAIGNALRKCSSNAYSEENLKKYVEGIDTYEETNNSYNKKDYLKHFSNILGIELKEDFLDILFEELRYVIPKEYTKIQKMLENLSNHYELVILTNYFAKSQRNRLNSMGVENLFSEFYGEKLIKPNSEVYISACGKNAPEECVMIGDDINLDIKGALDSGLKAIFINNKRKRESI